MGLKKRDSSGTLTTILDDSSFTEANCSSATNGVLKDVMRDSLNKKSVSFDSIEVYEHAITLGDNVVSDDGAPLTIEWDHHSLHILSVDDYERFRGPNRMGAPRKINARERFVILAANSIPMRESLLAASDAAKVRILRRQSLEEKLQDELVARNRVADSFKQRKTVFRLPKVLKFLSKSPLGR